MTIGAGVARLLMDLAVSKGARREVLERRCGIQSADLENQDSRVSLAKYSALMRAGKELCNDPALALHFGEAADPAEISVVGLIGAASTSMMDALAQVNRYSRLVVDVDTGGGDRFQIVRDDAGPWLVDARLDPNAFPEITESTFARMVSSARRRGYAPFARAVRLTHAEPSYRGEYDRIFGAPITFGSDRNAILLEEFSLDEKIPPRPRYVFSVLAEHADALIRSLEESKSVRGRVESLLMPVLHKGEARMHAIASQMSISRWTLSRRLKEESTTFEQVLDELRRKMALHYLSGKKVSVSETAYLVGFSEPAAFTRAFKRWTGMSPKGARSEMDRNQGV